MSQLSLIIAASGDDVSCDDDGGNYSATEVNAKLIHRDRAGVDKKQVIGLRFNNVTIPQGATINYAQLRLFSFYETSTSTILVRVYGEAADDAAAFSSGSDVTGRTTTTAYVDWDVGADQNWAANLWNGTPDLKSIISEIVGRAGWTSGNDIVLLLKDNGGTGTFDGHDVETYDRGASSAARIDIIYSETFAGPTLEGMGGQVASTTSTMAVQVPPERATDDLLLMWVASKPSGTAGTNDSITATGWTAVPSGSIRNEIGTDDLRADVFYRVSDGTETTANLTFGTAIAGTEGISAFITCHDLVDTTTPFDVTTVTSESNAADQWAPTGLTTASADTLVCSFVATSDDNALDVVTAQGFVKIAHGEAFDTTVGTDHAVGLAIKPVASASTAVTCPTWDITRNGTDQWVGITLALKKAGGATNATVTPSVVAAVAAVPAPTVSISHTITPATVAAVAAVPAPTIVIAVQAATVAAVASVPAPVLSTGVTVSPATVAAVAAVPAPTVSTGSSLTATVVAAVGAVPAPTVSTVTAASPATVAGTASVPTPTISTGSSVAAVAVVAAAAVPAPTVSTASDATVTATVVAAVAGVEAPTVTTGSSVAPAAVAAVASVPAPTLEVSSNATVTPSVVAATVGVPTPVLSTGATVAATVVAAVTDVGAPTIVTTANATVAPTVVAAVAAVGTPTPSTGSTVTATAVAAVAAVPAPSLAVSVNATVTPGTVAAVAAVGTPVLPVNATATPAAVAAVASVPAPTVSGTVLVTPTTVETSAAVPTPTVATSVTVTPSTVAALADVPTPTAGVPTVNTTVVAEVVAARAAVPAPGKVRGRRMAFTDVRMRTDNAYPREGRTRR